MAAGILMVALGMTATAVAVHRFLRNHRALTLGEPIDPSPAGPVALAVLMVLLGAVMVLVLGHTLLS
jgi:putative membrane protein